MTTPTATRPSVTGAWAHSHQAPLWVTISLHAHAHADHNGRVILEAGQLRAALGYTVTASAISRAIARAVKAGWLDSSSDARCLILAGSDA